MADWGTIGGISAGAGFLNGFATEYSRANAEKVARAAHQEDMLIRMFASALEQDDTLATNPGFHNAVAQSGLNPEAAQIINGFAALRASSPQTQQLAQRNEMMARLRGTVAGKFSDQYGPPASLDQMSAPEAAVLFPDDPTLTQSLMSRDKAKGGGKQPSLKYETYEKDGKKYTKRIEIRDGEIFETDMGSTPLTRKTKSLGEKERTDIGKANAILKTLDVLEEQVTNPADPQYRDMLGYNAVAKRVAGGAATKVLGPNTGAGNYVEGFGRSTEQGDFAATVSRSLNKDMHELYGAALTPGERASGERMVPDLSNNPKDFLGRLRASRKYVIRALESKLQALKENKVGDLPTIYHSRLDKAAASRAGQVNKRYKTRDLPEETTTAGGTGDAEVANYEAVFNTPAP